MIVYTEHAVTKNAQLAPEDRVEQGRGMKREDFGQSQGQREGEARGHEVNMYSTLCTLHSVLYTLDCMYSSTSIPTKKVQTRSRSCYPTRAHPDDHAMMGGGELRARQNVKMVQNERFGVWGIE